MREVGHLRLALATFWYELVGEFIAPIKVVELGFGNL